MDYSEKDIVFHSAPSTGRSPSIKAYDISASLLASELHKSNTPLSICTSRGGERYGNDGSFSPVSDLQWRRRHNSDSAITIQLPVNNNSGSNIYPPSSFRNIYIPDTSVWNDNLENTAKDIGEQIKGYKLMHMDVAQSNARKYFILMIIGMVIGPLGGTLSTIGAITNPANENIIIRIIVSILGYISGIIITIIKFSCFDEVSTANKQAAARYTSLESNVRRQLSLYRNDRIPPNQYIKWLETKYDELFYSAPLLPIKAYKKYSHNAERYGIKIANNYESIQINSKYAQDDERHNIMTSVSDIDINKETKQKERVERSVDEESTFVKDTKKVYEDSEAIDMKKVREDTVEGDITRDASEICIDVRNEENVTIESPDKSGTSNRKNSYNSGDEIKKETSSHISEPSASIKSQKSFKSLFSSKNKQQNVKRKDTMTNISDLNTFSDEMLAYEMSRMIRN